MREVRRSVWPSFELHSAETEYVRPIFILLPTSYDWAVRIHK